MGDIWGPYRGMRGDFWQEMQMTDDPSTPLIEAAQQMHEMVVTYEQAGFSRAEALQIVIAMVTSAKGGTA